jgi:hypothetical protein
VGLRQYLAESTEDAELALNWRMGEGSPCLARHGKEFRRPGARLVSHRICNIAEELEIGMARLIELLRVVLKEQQSG